MTGRRLWRVDGAVLVLVALGYIVVRAVWVPTGFWRGHLTDLLAGVALPSLMALVLDRTRQEPWWRTLGGKLALVLAATAVWEGIMPLIDRRSVADPLDVLAYAVGTLIQHALTRRFVSARPPGR